MRFIVQKHKPVNRAFIANCQVKYVNLFLAVTRSTNYPEIISRTEAHKMFPLHKDTNPDGVPISKDSQIKIFLDRMSILHFS